MASSARPTVLDVQRKEMIVGRQYLVVRARRTRRVTLLDRTSPTLGRGYVEVQWFEGVKAGEKSQVFCGSVIPLPGEEPERPKHLRKKPRRDASLTAQDDWAPRPRESVNWSQTGHIRLEVVEYDSAKKVAKVRGTILGVRKEYDAPRIELSPVLPALEAVENLAELEPEVVKVEHRDNDVADESQLPAPVDETDLVDRLTFSLKVIDDYRKRFRGGCSVATADKLLWKELKKAQLVRPRGTGDYLRFRRKGRFDVILKNPPSHDDPETTYITQLYFPPKKRRKHRRKAA